MLNGFLIPDSLLQEYFLAETIKAEGGLSLDLEPADKEPKNQNWLF